MRRRIHVVLLTAGLLSGCKKDRCPDGTVRSATTGSLHEEWCERGGVRDGYYEARDGVLEVKGEYRRGTRVDRWQWVTRDVSRPSRLVTYSDDGVEIDTGGFWRGERHGRFVTRSRGYGPDPDRWYLFEDITYRCDRVVHGINYYVNGEATPMTPGPPPPPDCPP